MAKISANHGFEVLRIRTQDYVYILRCDGALLRRGAWRGARWKKVGRVRLSRETWERVVQNFREWTDQAGAEIEVKHPAYPEVEMTIRACRIRGDRMRNC